MAADISAWLTTDSSALIPSATAEQRAARAWARINHKPTSVVFKDQAGTKLSAQTVRIESNNTSTESTSAAGKAARRGVVVFGVRDHATVTDTDMEKGYRFVYAGSEYQIQSVILTLGEIQGLAEAVS